MSPFTINPEDSQPIYQQLYRHIVGEMSAGRLREGEKLPSKRALAAHLHVSQTTVENAYTMLVTEGYLIARPRSGYYAAHLEQPLQASAEVEQTSVGISWPEKEPTEVAIQAHFRTNAVDTTLFPYSAWARIQRDVLHGSKELLNHGDVRGDAALREVLCKYLHEYRGAQCSPEQIVIGAGVEYLVGLVCMLLGAQSVFALEDPGYPKVRQIVRNHGRTAVAVPVGAQGMDLDALEKSGATAAYVTPSHQFPTGVTMPIPARMRLLTWAHARSDRFIIEDDYDSEFRYLGKPIPSLQGLDAQGKVIYLGTFSRTLAPSIRIAYMILPEQLLKPYHDAFSLYASTVSRFEQQTLARFIAEGHYTRHLNRVRSLYRRRKEYVVAALRALPIAQHLEIRGENAGLHFLLRVRGLGSEPELMARLRAAGIRVHSLREYAFGPGAADEPPALVLGYAGLSEEEISRSVSALGAALNP